VSYGATRRDRTGDLLITKNMLRLQTLYTKMPDINNLGKLLSLKLQLPTPQTDAVLAQFSAPVKFDELANRIGTLSSNAPLV
jgi:hypothetical protein